MKEHSPAIVKLTETLFKYIELSVVDCLSDKEIADKLNKSPYTVASQKKNIYRILNINKVTELARLYYTGAICRFLSVFMIIAAIGYSDYSQVQRRMRIRQSYAHSQLRPRRIRRRHMERDIPIMNLEYQI